MTKPDSAGTEPKASGPLDGFIIFGLFLGTIFALGVLAGFFSAAETLSIKAIVVGSLLALLAGLCAWQLAVRSLRLLGKAKEPVAQSQRKVQRMWFFLIGLGAMIGAASAYVGIQNGQGTARELTRQVFSSAPISPGIAMLLLAGMALVGIVTVYYLRVVDEHDLAAQNHASLVSVNLYVLLFLSWNIAAKGGLTGAVNHFAIFSITVLTYCAIWLWKRYF